MTSGTLPFHQYHRTSHLGDGSFGSVVIVYDDEGQEYAMKMFTEEEEEEEDEEMPQPMNLGILREISCLRVLRSQNAHPNIISLVDIQPKAISEDDDAEAQGAGTSHSLGMTLPYYKYGSIRNAIEQKHIFGNGGSKKLKVAIACGILHATDFLHNTCGILHRDIKSDNILLEYDAQNDTWRPILIDFSLAKPFRANLWQNHVTTQLLESLCWRLEDVAHTGEVGTLVYTAPEVMDQTHTGRYGPPVDLYSVGVVLLEVLRNELFTAEKYKEIVKQVHVAKDQMSSELPFPNLILQLLEDDPKTRIPASEALLHPVFSKFGLSGALKGAAPSTVDMSTALPYPETSLPEDPLDHAAPTKENHIINHTIPKKLSAFHGKGNATSLRQKKYERRLKVIDKVLHELESTHPLTRSAALDYSTQMEQLDDDMDSASSSISQSLLDCCILAFRFWECDVLDFEDLQVRGGLFQSWSYEEYLDNESTMFMMLDYCLYPREILTK
jgi:serine/threonine protein kinase